MLPDILIFVILIALIVLFAWLTLRAGRLKRAFLKWPARLVSGLLTLLAVAIFAFLIYGQVSFKPLQANRPLYEIKADMSAVGLARGKYLIVNVMGCAGGCHSPKDKTPFTGQMEHTNVGPAVLDFNVPNLTPDQETGLGSWSDAEIARAIREGVDNDGRSLVIMPSYSYHILSDADMAGVLGYLRSLPPTRNKIKPLNGNAFGKVILIPGVLIPASLGKPITTSQLTPASGTLESGAYLVSIASCNDCHKANLGGGSGPGGGMPAPNLTPGGELARWSDAEFLIAMRTGTKPDGSQLSSEMPFKEYGKMTDGDLRDIFKLLQSLPAVSSK